MERAQRERASKARTDGSALQHEHLRLRRRRRVVLDRARRVRPEAHRGAPARDGLAAHLGPRAGRGAFHEESRAGDGGRGALGGREHEPPPRRDGDVKHPDVVGRVCGPAVRGRRGGRGHPAEGARRHLALGAALPGEEAGLLCPEHHVRGTGELALGREVEPDLPEDSCGIREKSLAGGGDEDSGWRAGGRGVGWVGGRVCAWKRRRVFGASVFTRGKFSPAAPRGGRWRKCERRSDCEALRAAGRRAERGGETGCEAGGAPWTTPAPAVIHCRSARRPSPPYRPPCPRLRGGGRGSLAQAPAAGHCSPLALSPPPPRAEAAAPVGVVARPLEDEREGLEPAVRVLGETRQLNPVVHAVGPGPIEVGAVAPARGAHVGRVAGRVEVLVVDSEEERVLGGSGGVGRVVGPRSVGRRSEKGVGGPPPQGGGGGDGRGVWARSAEGWLSGWSAATAQRAPQRSPHKHLGETPLWFLL